MTLEARERHGLADLLLEVGPDAATLCDGWTTRDLAAHMVVLEHPEGYLGIESRRVEWAVRNHDRIIEHERSKPWPEQVERLRRGPERGPFSWPWLRERWFLREYLVHHEDVRRANGAGPRTDTSALQEVAWRKLRTMARLLMRDVERGTALALQRDDGRVITVRKHGAPLRVVGEPIELLLYAFGRTDAADVRVERAGTDPVAM